MEEKFGREAVNDADEERKMNVMRRPRAAAKDRTGPASSSS